MSDEQEKPKKRASKPRNRRVDPASRNLGRARKLKMTPERKALFIEKLAEFGVAEWAAVEASPGAKGSCISTFHDAAERDPEFADEWTAAMERGRMRVVREAYRRAVEGDQTYGKDGAPTGKRYSDSLMGLILKSKQMGGQFTEKQEIEHSGTVERGPDLGIADLSKKQRAKLRDFLATLEDDVPE